MPWSACHDLNGTLRTARTIIILVDKWNPIFDESAEDPQEGNVDSLVRKAFQPRPRGSSTVRRTGLGGLNHARTESRSPTVNLSTSTIQCRGLSVRTRSALVPTRESGHDED